MSSHTEYQAIPVGPEQVAFNPENSGRSRFFSLLHLTPSKAAVLATTIVCITFAALHFTDHPLTQRSNALAYHSLFRRSGPFAAAPASMETSRGNICDWLKKYPEDCQNSFYHFNCDMCGISRQIVGKFAAAPASMETSRGNICDWLKKYPEDCQNSFYHYNCDMCGIPY